MDRLIEWFDRDALLAGMAIAVGGGLVLTLVTAAADPDDGSPWVALSLIGVLVVFGTAGFVTGRRLPRRALSHGAVVGLASFVVIQLLVLPISLLSNDGFETEKIPGLVFVAFMLSNVALVGGMLGSRIQPKESP